MSEYDITPILSSIWPEWSIIGRPLGVGTYGDVYKITRNNDTLSGDAAVISESAVKIIQIPRNHSEIDTLGENPSFIQQSCREYESIARNFSSEIKLLETLKASSNVVHIEDYKILRNPDEIGWTIVIRMELLKPIKELYPFSEEETVRLGIDICSALEICFQKNIIHRDIKPSNIFCTEFGTYKLGDFGIARIMQSADNSMTTGVGTPNFIAPEVINGLEYDYRADIYSLGMVLYHLLNNQTPPFCPLDKQILSYQDRTDAYFRRIHGEILPPPINASPRMTEIIFKACAFRPQDRYTSAAEMKQDLAALLSGQNSVPQKTVPEKQKTSKPVIAFVLLALLTAAAGTGYLLCNRPQNSISAEEQFNENRIEAEQRMSDIVRLEVEKYPSRSLYSVGEVPDLTGLVLRAEYKDGTAESIRTGYECSLPILEQTGVQSIAVSYGGQTVMINLAVKELFGYELNEDGESCTLTELLDKETSTVTLPVSYMGKPVTGIGANAFKKCRITELIVPEGYTTIEGHAFYKCSELERIVLPQTLINLSNHYDGDGVGTPFACCTSLVSLEITPGNPIYSSVGNCIIETASNTLLYGCGGSIIPEDGSVTTIASLAFDEIYNLKQLIIPEGVTKLGKMVFDGSELEELSISKTVTSIQTLGTWCDNLRRITVDPENPVYSSDGYQLIENSTKTLIYSCTESIPEDGSVEIIGEAAYTGKTFDLLEIPEGIVRIEEDAFIGSSIRELHIPSTVRYIHPTAFVECRNLSQITVSPENTVYHSDGNCAIETASKTLVTACPSSVIPTDGSVKKIGEYAYYHSNLTSVEIPETIEKIMGAVFSYTDLQSVRIPSKVKKLYEHTFLHCSKLETIYLPAALTLIQQDAFAECDALKTVYYAGSRAEWEKITIEANNDALLNAEIIFDYAD